MTSALLTPTASRERLTGHLPALTRRLERERAFRLEQLAELGAASVTGPGDRAQREVADLVTAAATVALNDIEIALLRIEIGTYGRCHTCHVDLPGRLLEAIPQARLCLACQDTDTRKTSHHDGSGRRRGGMPVRTQEVRRAQ